MISITDVPCSCTCGWRGTVGDCVPDIDGDGNLGCPVCSAVVIAKMEEEMMTPEERAKCVFADWIEDEDAMSDGIIPYIAKAISTAAAEETARLQHQLSLSQAAVAELQERLMSWKAWEHAWIFGGDAKWPGDKGTADPRDTVRDMDKLIGEIKAEAVAAEREACATIVEYIEGWNPIYEETKTISGQLISYVELLGTLRAIAAAIRARGEAEDETDD